MGGPQGMVPPGMFPGMPPAMMGAMGAAMGPMMGVGMGPMMGPMPMGPPPPPPGMRCVWVCVAAVHWGLSCLYMCALGGPLRVCACVAVTGASCYCLTCNTYPCLFLLSASSVCVRALNLRIITLCTQAHARTHAYAGPSINSKEVADRSNSSSSSSNNHSSSSSSRVSRPPGQKGG